jgi:hypothetical protein
MTFAKMGRIRRAWRYVWETVASRDFWIGFFIFDWD